MSKYQLRDYQKKIISDTRNALKHGYRSPLIVSPTGSGKTIIFIYIAVNSAKRGFRTTVVVHRSYLWQQISEKLKELDIPHGIIAPGHTQTDDMIQIASVDTLIRRLPKTKKPHCLIFDEAHHVIKNNKWGKIAEYYNSYIIGVTATPCRTNGHGLGASVGGFFDYMVMGPQIADLQPEFLSPFKLFAPDIGVCMDGVKKVYGDYEKKEMLTRIDNQKIYGNVPMHYKRICNGVPAIAFCASVKHAENVASEFNSNGISAIAVSGKTKENDRQEIFKGLANGKYLVVCSCDLVSEGFDVPICGAAICLRPTQSLSLCLQQWGRTTRVAPGKQFAYIIDHVGNYVKHGYPDDIREWTLEGVLKKKKKGSEKTISLKVCQECFAVYSDGSVCPQCGFISKIKSQKDIDVDNEAELKEIETKLQIERKETVRKARTLEELYSVAKRLGYKKGWAYYTYQSRLKKQRKVTV